MSLSIVSLSSRRRHRRGARLTPSSFTERPAYGVSGERETRHEKRGGTGPSLTASHSSLLLMPSAFGSGLMLHG